MSGFTIVNVDAAHTLGLELEAKTWLTEDFELQGSIGLLRSKIDKYASSPDNKGNHLSSAPEANLGLGFTQYVGDRWSFGADVTYVSEYYSNLSNARRDMAGDYVVSNARFQYETGDITIDGFIKNLTDEDVLYYRADSLAAVGQDRSVGISITYRM